MFLKELTVIFGALNLMQNVAAQNERWWESQSPFKCCQCVPFYACKNSIIDPSQMNVSDTRRANPEGDVQECSHPTDFCCLFSPRLPPECESFLPGPKIPPINQNPQPNKPCHCTHWETCPLDFIVTDGKRPVPRELQELNLVSHSKCTEPLHVCCEHEGAARTEGSVTRTHGHQECECVPHDLCLEDGTINTSGEGIIIPRTRTDNRGNFIPPKQCENPSEICCFPPRHSGGTGITLLGQSTFQLSSFLLAFTSLFLIAKSFL